MLKSYTICCQYNILCMCCQHKTLNHFTGSSVFKLWRLLYGIVVRFDGQRGFSSLELLKMVLFIMHNLSLVVYHLKLLTLVYTTAVMQWFTEFMELFLSSWELNNFWSLTCPRVFCLLLPTPPFSIKMNHQLQSRRRTVCILGKLVSI